MWSGHFISWLGGGGGVCEKDRKVHTAQSQYTIIVRTVDEEIPPMIGMKIEAMHIYFVLTDKRTKIMYCNYIDSTYPYPIPKANL